MLRRLARTSVRSPRYHSAACKGRRGRPTLHKQLCAHDLRRALVEPNTHSRNSRNAPALAPRRPGSFAVITARKCEAVHSTVFSRYLTRTSTIVPVDCATVAAPANEGLAFFFVVIMHSGENISYIRSLARGCASSAVPPACLGVPPVVWSEHGAPERFSAPER